MQNKEVPGGQETVLLRYPVPKYNFKGRKLEKTPSELSHKSRTNLIQETGLTTEVSKKQDSDHALKSEKDAKNIREKEIRTQNDSVRNSSTNNVQHTSSFNQTVQKQSNVSSSASSHSTDVYTNISPSYTVSANTQPVCVSCHSTKEKDNIEGFVNQYTQPMVSDSSRSLYEPVESSVTSGSPACQWQAQHATQQTAAVFNNNLREENESLKSQLNIQLKVCFTHACTKYTCLHIHISCMYIQICVRTHTGNSFTCTHL